MAPSPNVVISVRTLSRVRSLLRYERDALVDCSCVHVDGKPDLSTLDKMAAPLLRRYEKRLREIDAALAGEGAA